MRQQIFTALLFQSSLVSILLTYHSKILFLHNEMSLPSSVVLKAVQSENMTSKGQEAIIIDGESEFLTEDKGLVKKIIKKGEGDTPPKGSKVSSKT